MGKTKHYFSPPEKKLLISAAYKLYLVEMYLAEKSMEVSRVKCDECEHITERPVSALLSDYQTQKSIDTLAAVFELLEPKIFNDKISGKHTVEMVRQIVIYLTGIDMIKEANMKPVIKPAKSDAAEAVQAAEMMNPNKIKKLEIIKTVPKRVQDKISGKK